MTLEQAASKLGTKEFWNDHYSREILNFEKNGDEGEIWFGKIAEQKIINFIIDKYAMQKDVQIIEIGTGNGSLLRKLKENGFTHLWGIDYSEKALELAEKACASNAKTCSETSNIIKFKLIDLMNSESIDSSLNNSFDCIIDKGTFDAISLTVGIKKTLFQPYIKKYLCSVHKLFKKHNKTIEKFFVIVSCNFTKEELIEMLETDEMKIYQVLPPSASFSFGNSIGSTFTGVIFKFV